MLLLILCARPSELGFKPFRTGLPRAFNSWEIAIFGLGVRMGKLPPALLVIAVALAATLAVYAVPPT